MIWFALGGSGVAAFAVWLLVRRSRAAGRAAAARRQAEEALDARRRADTVDVHDPERVRRRLRRATSEPVAPAPVGYADTVQARAAEELAELPPPCPRDATSAGCSAVHRLVLDYERLRRRVRAIRNRRGD